MLSVEGRCQLPEFIHSKLVSRNIRSFSKTLRDGHIKEFSFLLLGLDLRVRLILANLRIHVVGRVHIIGFRFDSLNEIHLHVVHVILTRGVVKVDIAVQESARVQLVLVELDLGLGS